MFMLSSVFLEKMNCASSAPDSFQPSETVLKYRPPKTQPQLQPQQCQVIEIHSFRHQKEDDVVPEEVDVCTDPTTVNLSACTEPTKVDPFHNIEVAVTASTNSLDEESSKEEEEQIESPPNQNYAGETRDSASSYRSDRHSTPGKHISDADRDVRDPAPSFRSSHQTPGNRGSNLPVASKNKQETVSKDIQTTRMEVIRITPEDLGIVVLKHKPTQKKRRYLKKNGSSSPKHSQSKTKEASETVLNLKTSYIKNVEKGMKRNDRLYQHGKRSVSVKRLLQDIKQKESSKENLFEQRFQAKLKASRQRITQMNELKRNMERTSRLYQLSNAKQEEGRRIRINASAKRQKSEEPRQQLQEVNRTTLFEKKFQEKLRTSRSRSSSSIRRSVMLYELSTGEQQEGRLRRLEIEKKSKRRAAIAQTWSHYLDEDRSITSHSDISVSKITIGSRTNDTTDTFFTDSTGSGNSNYS